MIKMEKQFILELCKIDEENGETIKRFLQENLDYTYVLGQLHMHRMAGAAYYTLQKHNLLGAINREFRNSLRIVYQYNQYWMESYQYALQKIAEILVSANFSYAVLKGALLTSMYPAGIRTSNDLDLLIQRKDIPEAVSLFSKEGFVQGFIRKGYLEKATRKDIINAQLNRGEIIPFIKRVDWKAMEFLEVDMNVSLDEKPMENAQVVEEMLENRREMDGNLCLYTLNEIDFFLHLCTHLYKEASVYQWVIMGRDLSLYKFYDIYCYFKQKFSKTDVLELARRIKRFGIEKDVSYSLIQTHALWPFQEEAKEVMEQLLEAVCPENRDFLDEVHDPATKKRYRFRQPFIERLFDGKRGCKMEEWI